MKLPLSVSSTGDIIDATGMIVFFTNHRVTDTNDAHTVARAVNGSIDDLSKAAQVSHCDVCDGKCKAECRYMAENPPISFAQVAVANGVVPDARLGNLLHVWDYENPEDGHWDNIEEFLHDTTPSVGETVRLNLAAPLDDVEVEMIEVGKSGEPIRWVVRDAKTGALLAAQRAEKEEGK